MTSGVTMRSSKARTLLYVLAGCALMFLVLVLSSTHTKLKDAEESNDKCQQQRDSLSAQLQVLYEHKSRLEKSLQTEMADRKKTENELNSLREDMNKEKMDINTRYQELQKRFDDIQKSHLEEFGNLKGSYASIQGEKEKLEADLGKQMMLVQQGKDTEKALQDQILHLQSAYQQEREKLGAVQNQLSMCQARNMELVQEVSRYSAAAAAAQANFKPPVALQSVMSPQKAAVPADRSAHVQDAAKPADKAIVAEKAEKPSVQQKDEKLSGGALGLPEKVQQKDEKLSGGALGLPEKEPQKQAPAPAAASQSGAVPERSSPSSVLQLANSKNEKQGSSSSPAPKVEQGQVKASVAASGSVQNEGSLNGNQVRAIQEENPPHDQVPPPRDPVPAAAANPASPQSGLASPAPAPPQDGQQPLQQPTPAQQGADKAVGAAAAHQEAGKEENQGRQDEPHGAIPAPQPVEAAQEKPVQQQQDSQDNILPPQFVDSPQEKQEAQGAIPMPRPVDVDEGGDSQVRHPRPLGNGAEEGAPKEQKMKALGHLARPVIMDAAKQGIVKRGPWYAHPEEENREYIESAREDDAGDDQDADGGLLAGADQRKQFQDADFDDQGAEPENQLANQIPEEGMMVNPK